VPGIVFHPGPGKIAAGAAAQWALLAWQPQRLVVLGTCGSINPEKAPLDLLAARRTVVYDFTSAVPAARDGMRRAYRIDLPELPDLAGLTHPVHPAVLATGDGDPSAAQLAQLRQEEAAEAVDWESGAVAWVCRQNRVPCLILRGVSDDATAAGAAQQAAYAQRAPQVMDRLWTVWEDLLAAGRVAAAR
jgi:nucleoside phosphorylase